jgi:hypothetical protein
MRRDTPASPQQELHDEAGAIALLIRMVRANVATT